MGQFECANIRTTRWYAYSFSITASVVIDKNIITAKYVKYNNGSNILILYYRNVKLDRHVTKKILLNNFFNSLSNTCRWKYLVLKKTFITIISIYFHTCRKYITYTLT